MKTLFKFVLLFAISFPGIMFTGCEQNADISEQISPQLSRGTCDHLSTDDLDLSEGFRGSHEEGVTSSDPDFSVKGHDSNYNFPEGSGTGDCDGFCSIRITFKEAHAESSLDVNSLVISALSLSYLDGVGASFTNPVADYVWSYPHLDIYETYTNTITDYDVSFANNLGSFLSVVEVEVTGGLCVIDNVNQTDPIKHVIIDIPNNDPDI